MSNLAIIPARGGSKRIPRKNIKDFLGKPIIAYSIEAALQSNLFDEVMVSTDNEEIAEIAEKHGAQVPFLRSRENSDDFSTTVDVLHEVIEKYRDSNGKTFDYGCCIYPTAPFTTPNILKEGFDKIEGQKFDTLFPVVSFGYPIWRSLEINEREKAKMIWPEFLNSRSQDLKKAYHDAGQWYWFNISKLKDSLFTNNSGCLELEEKQVQDIDNESDWQIAEIKFRYLYKNAGKGNS